MFLYCQHILSSGVNTIKLFCPKKFDQIGRILKLKVQFIGTKLFKKVAQIFGVIWACLEKHHFF